MNQENTIKKIANYEDIINTLKLFFASLEKQDLSFDKLNEFRMAEIDKMDQTEEEKTKTKKAQDNLTKKMTKTKIKGLVMRLLQTQIAGSIIKIDEVFNYINEIVDRVEKEFGKGFGIEFDIEDRFSFQLDLVDTVYESFTTLSTLNYDEKEIKLINEYREKTLKHNRAFGRKTEQMDSMENK